MKAAKTNIQRLALLTLAIAVLSACSKSNSPAKKSSGDCSQDKTGIIYFYNTHNDPYDIYINGTNVGINTSGGTVDVPVKSIPYITGVGTVWVKAVQRSGFTSTPYTFSSNVSLLQCDTTIYKF